MFYCAEGTIGNDQWSLPYAAGRCCKSPMDPGQSQGGGPGDKT